MPLLSPAKSESKEKFVSRFMSNEAMEKEFSEQDQRVAVANSQWSKSKKEKLYSKVNGLEIKENDAGDLISGGYIATTHLDEGFLDTERNVWIRDRLTKGTLDEWRDEINEGVPRANKVSIHHNREEHVAGVGIKGTARVDSLGVEDGKEQYGLYVDSLIDKTKDNFADTKYRLDRNLLDSYSIEFRTRDPATFKYMPGAVEEVETDAGIMRTILPGTELNGWTLASHPMNEHAIMIKEIKELIDKKNKENKEDKMAEDKDKDKDKDKELSEEEKKKKAEEEKKKKAEAGKGKPEDKKDEKKELSEEVKEKLAKLDLMEQKEAKDTLRKEIILELKEDMKKELEKKELANKAMNNGAGNVIESKEFKEFKDVMECKTKLHANGTVTSEQSIDKQWKVAGDIISLKENFMFNRMIEHGTKLAVGREYKHFTTNGRLLEYKGLGITTNQNTDTDYLLSAAELSDVFDPVIYNALNQKHTTWNMLAKDDYSTKGNNQMQFTLKTVANTTAGAYTGNAVSTGNVTRMKYMTKFKKYQVGVEVDGDMIAAARGGPVGDVFAQEVKDSVDDLMPVMNAALYAEVGLESAAGVIGFEFICDYAGNTTMYNLTRSTANHLRPASNTDTYINGASADLTKKNLRKAMRQAVEKGADLNNLVFFCSPIQYDKVKEIYDDAGRINAPMSARFGFEGKMSFEEVPIFFDRDCNDDDVFLVDLETHRIGMWVPPTLEMLGKDADSQKGFVKTYWGIYNRAPLRMVMIYGNKTT